MSCLFAMKRTRIGRDGTTGRRYRRTRPSVLIPIIPGEVLVAESDEEDNQKEAEEEVNPVGIEPEETTNPLLK